MTEDLFQASISGPQVWNQVLPRRNHNNGCLRSLKVLLCRVYKQLDGGEFWRGRQHDYFRLNHRSFFCRNPNDHKSYTAKDLISNRIHHSELVIFQQFLRTCFSLVY